MLKKLMRFAALSFCVLALASISRDAESQSTGRGPVGSIYTGQGQTRNPAFVLTPGTAGSCLVSNGAGQLPTYQGCANPAAGIDTNLLATGAVITTAPTVDSSFCGKTAALGGTAFYTFTVGAASGFPATCSILVTNIDTVRAKTMAINGVIFPQLNKLYALQSVTLKNVNNTWQLFGEPKRWKCPTAGCNFFVDPGGSNANNDGLAAGTGNAFATITFALNNISQNIDAGQNPVSITLLCSGGQTYTEQVILTNVVGALTTGNIGSATPTIIGNTTTPSNCTITQAGAGSTILAVGQGTEWLIRGVKITQTGSGVCVTADKLSIIDLGEIDFGACAAHHMDATYGSIVRMQTNYTISGVAAIHSRALHGGRVVVGSGVNVTITGTPAFALGFAFANYAGTQEWTGVTFTGTATGNKCSIDTGGGINTSTGNVNFLPGNVACSPTAGTFGWYG